LVSALPAGGGPAPRARERGDGLLEIERCGQLLARRCEERRAHLLALGALARDLGVAVIVNRPFAEGALFRRIKGKSLPPWAAELGIASWAQFFLKWIASHPAVTCAIPGTGKPEHMLDNLEAGRGRLPDEAQRRSMAQYFDSL